MRTLIRPNPQGVFPRIKPGVVHDVALGNSSMFPIVVITDDGFGSMFVAVERHGAYCFSTQAHAGYVSEKLKIKHEGDAENIANFINDQMFEPGEVERQGRYAPKLCSTT